ncbi:TIGR00730 family Rossman fold protein [Pediococcus pentosaceus]|uniref:LOG family protein n=1 Tax=Pediococcus pentosaceus TaxID=1255 RepID=UPI001303761A|nr:TIGR00730 family Rossman fold protein [Pediococcus pentosaceus]QGZ69563.1 TIGR00730 family Rossman fold protein [Pediococcus pentosaceus]
MKITVFCGARFGNQKNYGETARLIGNELAKRKIELVYGGSTSGTMGAISQAVLENGGKVTGIYPEWLFEDKLPRKNTTSFIQTTTMAQRKELLINSGDAFLILPGGLGTLEELSQLLSNMALGIIPQRKIGILNINGFYDNLIQLLNNFIDAKFMDALRKDDLLISADYQVLLEELTASESKSTKQELSA